MMYPSSIIKGPPPQFVLPSLAALRWAAAWMIGIVSVPAPHHTWAWLCLLPFLFHLWRALAAGERYIAARVRLQFEQARREREQLLQAERPPLAGRTDGPQPSG